MHELYEGCTLDNYPDSCLRWNDKTDLALSPLRMQGSPDNFCGYVIIQPEFRIGDQSIQEKMQGRANARPFVNNLFEKYHGAIVVRPIN